MLPKSKEAYCPTCKSTKEMGRAYTNNWLCYTCHRLLTTEELNQAFLNISKDKSYKTKKTTATAAALTLPTDSEARKGFPLFSGCLRYFAAALAGVARTSKIGNDKHNPGEPMHHARSKSMDHGDCIIRHLMDLEDMLAANMRASEKGQEVPFKDQQVLDEAGSLCWRALALSQELHERLGAAPLAPGAKK